MSCYGSLAQWYDQLTGDVPYGSFADFYEAEFARCGGEFRLLLDLCCGTGTLTALMAERGYELIAADSSVDMLMQAREKTAALETPPLFLCQDAAELDLYGTVDAAYCSLDGMNYIPPASLGKVFHRLHLFIRPDGLLIFDIRPPEWLRALDGQVFVDEQEDVLCLWRGRACGIRPQPGAASAAAGGCRLSRRPSCQRRAAGRRGAYVYYLYKELNHG